MYARNNESSNQKHELHLAAQVHGCQRLTFRYHSRNEKKNSIAWFRQTIACLGKKKFKSHPKFQCPASKSVEHSRKKAIFYDLGSGIFPLFFLSRYKYVNEIKLDAVSPWVKCLC